MIRAVIIDDEPAMQQVNSRYLQLLFPEIELAGIADSVESGKQLVEKENPDLVLLDVELGKSTGFNLLNLLKPYSFKVVFITGYDSYALKAIKFSAIEYILKPVDENDFKSAISKAITEINQEQHHEEQGNYLLDSIRKEFNPKKLVLKTADSLHIIDINEILFCQSDNSYTTFYIENEDKIIVSKSIKEYEELLKEHHFFRSHQSYLVNLNHIKKVDKSDGGYLVMTNKKEIPVSIRQKKRLLHLLENL